MKPPLPHARLESLQERWIELLTRGWREPGDLDATLTHIAEVARESFTADLCVIFAINPITRRFVTNPGVAGDLRPRSGQSPLKEPRKHGLTRRVIDCGYLAVEDPTALDEDETGFCRNQQIRRFAAVVLHTVRHKRPFAVLYVDYRRSGNFDAGLEEQLRRFAQLASRELQITWFLRRYQWVGQIGQEINRHHQTEAELFSRLWKKVRHIIDTSHCFQLGVYSPEKDTLDFFSRVDGREISEEGFSFNRPVEQLVKGEARLASVLEDEMGGLLGAVEGPSGSPPWQPRSQVIVPLLMAGRLLGILAVQHPEPNAYDDEDRHLLKLVGNQVSLALSNRRLYDHLSRLHEVGKTLTRDLESKTVLQTIADAIRTTTGCDFTVLYPYSRAARRFKLPPKYSGALEDESFSQPQSVEAGSVVDVVFNLTEPMFAEDAREVFGHTESHGRERTDSFQQREKIRSVAALPLRVGEDDEEAVGALFVNYRTRQRFGDDPALRQLILGMAGHAAIAIKNAREFGNEQRRYVKTLEGLRELDQVIIQHPDNLDRLLNLILKIACKRLGDRVAPDEASILLHDPYQDELVTRAAIGVHSPKSLRQVLRPEDGRGITLEVLRTGESVLVPDVRSPEWRGRFVGVGGGTRCEMDVPLTDGDRMLGIINLESRKARAFDKADLELMETLAGQAVIAVKTAQAHEEEQRIRQDEAALIELAKKLTQRLEVEELLGLILEAAIENTKGQAGVLALIDQKQGDLIVKEQRGAPTDRVGRRLSRDEGILGLVAREGEMVNADLTDPKWQKLHIPTVEGMKSEIAFPLKRRGKVVGVLNVESPELRYFSLRNEQLLTGLTDLAVIALQNAERFEASERRRKRFGVLYEAGRELARVTAPDHLDDAYGVVVRKATEQWNCEVVVRRLDPVAQTLKLVKCTGRSDPAPYPEIPLSDPLAGKVVRERCTVYVADALNPPPDVGEFPRSNRGDRAFVVTPIALEKDYYGNLALSHSETDHFRSADRKLVEGLAKQLAVAIYRLEETEAHQSAEKRAVEAEKMGEVGRQTYELMHRLGNDLGLVRTSVRKIRAALEKQGRVEQAIEIELGRIHNDVRGVLGVSKKLANELSDDRRGGPSDHGGDPKTYPVRELIQHGIDSLALNEVEQQKIHVELDLAENPMEVSVDYRRFSDALLNLLTNAVEAMPDGGTLTVGAGRRGSKVEIWVQDIGRGISPSKRARLFDLGFTTKPGSSGFGLWSVKRTIVNSGGDITVGPETKPTRFTITLPHVEEEPSA